MKTTDKKYVLIIVCEQSLDIPSEYFNCQIDTVVHRYYSDSISKLKKFYETVKNSEYIVFAKLKKCEVERV